MQIQTIEQKTGLDRATIRYYEQEGLVLPQRLQNGYRDYSEKNLQDLLKIKLLRQLGLPLETIQQLIEGREELQIALGKQLEVIQSHKDYLAKAESICKMIMKDSVTYQTFQPNKYLTAAEVNQTSKNKVIDLPDSEYVYCEVHPVRRFLARYLDQLFVSALLMLIIVVFMRVRPYSDLLNSALSVAALLLSMPINALFLCILGTTPGKFAMGIFLKNPDGKNLSFRSAIRREWAVFRYGSGYNIPIYSWVRLYKSYQIHTAGLELEWDYDYDADVLYTNWTKIRYVYTSILGIICTIAIIFSVQDSALPKYRGKDLTLAQYAENYNDYAQLSNMGSYLSERGEWQTPANQPNVVIVDPYKHKENWQFVVDDNKHLKQIKIEIQTDSSLFIVGGGRTEIAVLTAVMSQPGADLSEGDAAVQYLSELAFLIDKKQKNGYSKHNGVIIRWELQQSKDNSDKVILNVIMP